MQNFVPHKKWYQINQVDGSEYSKETIERYEKLHLYRKLQAENCSEQTALEAIGMPRSTYYRWKKRYDLYGLAGLESISKRPNNFRKPTWTKKTEKIVLYMRRKYRLWGKEKLAVMIKRELGITMSPSTIGRILKKLIAKGKIKPVIFLYGKKSRKPRKFSGHAKRWKYGMKATKPGELIPVDQMTIEIGGKTFKHFQAICPITKVVVKEAYRRATSQTAARFLEKILADLPFKVISLQVDGGSEFMGFFEELCKKENIPLYVLPPCLLSMIED